jgi:hypothetical protein
MRLAWSGHFHDPMETVQNGFSAVYLASKHNLSRRI